MSDTRFDLIVIGAGPGGYVAAIRASQLGLRVALIEKREHLGGTCLNVGCIPTKALLESAKTYVKLQSVEKLGFQTGDIAFDWQKIMQRKDGIVDDQRKGLLFLMKKNKIQTFAGHGRIKDRTHVTVTDKDDKVTTLETKNILLASGSRVRELPFAKADHKNVLTSDSILFIDHVPKTLAVIGGGIVGMEFASMFGRFGTEVTVIELAPRILPSEDGEVVKDFLRHIGKQNVKIEAGTKLTGIAAKKDKVEVTVEGKDARSFDKVLLSIGREPVTEDIGLDRVGLERQKGGTIKVNEHYQTAVPNIYAIGDIIGTPALAHTASAEGIHAAEKAAGHHPHKINYAANPNAVYTYPEIASLGMNEEQVKEKGIEYKSIKFPFAPMAKAKIEGATEGFVKLIWEPKYKEILGVHIIGARATEMISEFVVGQALETTLDELGQAIHPHPTISETAMEAVHAALGAAIHM